MGSLPDSLSDLEAALSSSVQRRFGSAARVENIDRATLGGSNRTLIFDLVEGTTRRRLVSREETFAGETNPFLSPAAQFRVLRHVHAHGVPSPEPIFEFEDEDELGTGFVVAFVAGETLPRKLLLNEASHHTVLTDVAEAVARLHALPLEPVQFLEDIPESGEPVAAMRMRIDSLGEPHPALELGLRWLELNPAPARERVLLHGDLRNGNLLVGGGKLNALLDWECSHFGSPAEDLGWFCTRSWRFGQVERHAGGFGTRSELIAAYRDASNRAVEADEVRWWERYGLVRWAMYNILQAHGFVSGRRSPAYAACGRNTAMYEYDLLMSLLGEYD